MSQPSCVSVEIIPGQQMTASFVFRVWDALLLPVHATARRLDNVCACVCLFHSRKPKPSELLCRRNWMKEAQIQTPSEKTILMECELHSPVFFFHTLTHIPAVVILTLPVCLCWRLAAPHADLPARQHLGLSVNRGRLLVCKSGPAGTVQCDPDWRNHGVNANIFLCS